MTPVLSSLLRFIMIAEITYDPVMSSLSKVFLTNNLQNI